MARSASAARLLCRKMCGLVRVRVRARDRAGIRVASRVRARARARIRVRARARIRVRVQRCAAFSDARLAFTPSISRWSIARAEAAAMLSAVLTL